MEAEERPTKIQKLEHPSIMNNDQNYNSKGHNSEEPVTNDASNNDSPFIETPEATEKRKRTPPPNGMSRSAYKKLKRQQEWEAGKGARKAKRKEKEKMKKEAKKASKGDSDHAIAPPAESTAQKRQQSIQVPVTFIIDCDFDDLMTDNEIKSLASQITRCYSDNVKSKYKVHLAVSSFNKRLKERFDTALEKQYESWKGFRFFAEDFLEVSKSADEWMRDPEKGGKTAGTPLGRQTVDSEADKSLDMSNQVIYLSSESDNSINELKPYSTYVIGGLVDRNRHKGICYKKAMDRGVATAKLPIGEFLQMNSRYVLATNHVNEIMLKWLQVGDWGDAFMKVIPKRKGGALKAQSVNGDGVEQADYEASIPSKDTTPEGCVLEGSGDEADHLEPPENTDNRQVKGREGR